MRNKSQTAINAHFLQAPDFSSSQPKSGVVQAPENGSFAGCGDSGFVAPTIELAVEKQCRGERGMPPQRGLNKSGQSNAA
jgi:hypothetical protein